MAQLVVRNLEEEVKAGLQARARRHGRSMEEEVREILRACVAGPRSGGVPLGQRLRARFEKVGFEQDVEELHGAIAEPADLG